MSDVVLSLLSAQSYTIATFPHVRLEQYQHPPYESRWFIIRGDSYLNRAGVWKRKAITLYETMDEAAEALGRLVSEPKKRRIRRELVGFELKTNPRLGRCPVVRCRRPASPRHCGLCIAHYMMRWRRENPLLAAYNTLRDHAKGRKIPFSISYDYFCGLADSLAYEQKRGNSSESLTIDRVDVMLGYVRGNLRVVTVAENVAKGNRERYLPEYVQKILAGRKFPAPAAPQYGCSDDQEENPF